MVATENISHQYHTIVIGAGFSGVCMGVHLKKNNLHNFLILEKSSTVGGTWWENKYPGAECDVESHLYSFEFEPNPNWSRIWSGSDEIQQYVSNVAIKYDLMKHLHFNEKVVELTYHVEGYWKVVSNQQQIYYSQFVIFSASPLHCPNLPAIPGIESFQGKLLHTSTWDREYPLKGKRIGMIGCAASGIQCAPHLQQQASTLTIFQRTPQWILPKGNRNFLWIEKVLFRVFPWLNRLYRNSLFYQHEFFWSIFFKESLLSKICMWCVKLSLKWYIRDTTLFQKIIPSYPMGCKRILVSDDFYPAIIKPNVNFVTGAIEKVTANSVITPDGKEYPIDVLVLATGFQLAGAINAVKMIDTSSSSSSSCSSSPTSSSTPVTSSESSTAASSPPPTSTVSNNNSEDVKEKGKEFGPVLSELYGIYPKETKNFFTLLGYNSGSTYTSVLLYMESQVKHIIDMMKYMSKNNKVTVQVNPEFFHSFNAKLQQDTKALVLDQCKSWYVVNGINVALYPHSVMQFDRTLKELDFSKAFVLK